MQRTATTTPDTTINNKRLVSTKETKAKRQDEPEEPY